MTNEQYIKNLSRPKGQIDVFLDTDAAAEIDDLYAIGYLLSNTEKFRVKGFGATMFSGWRARGIKESMEDSFNEILKMLKLTHREDLSPLVFKGSGEYLPDEKTPVKSDSSEYLAKLADSYTAENPLYVVAIGCITNVANAVLLNPEMKEKTVIVWLGGHAQHMPDTKEYNMCQDYAAARVLFGCGVPLIQLPCKGVVDRLSLSKPEIELWLKGKNEFCDYIADLTIFLAERYAKGSPWTRVIWDVTTLYWLADEGDKYMQYDLREAPMPTYDGKYEYGLNNHLMGYVYNIERDAIFNDLLRRLGNL